jgi:outer membrane lipoprotein-sorting protein
MYYIVNRKMAGILLSLKAVSVLGQELDMREIFSQMQKSFQKIDNYECIFENFVRKGDKSRRATYKYYFKKPNKVRLEVISGKCKGACLLYSGKKVKVKLGSGILSLFTYSFSPDHKWVCNPRGFGLHQSDWGWYIDQHLRFLEHSVCEVIKKDTIDGKEVIFLEIVSQNPEQTVGIAREKIWIDWQHKIPIKYEQYDTTGTLIQLSNYKEIRLNCGLKDDLFK